MKAAFLVGVSRYDSLANLPACKHDVSIMESLLKATKNYEEIIAIQENTDSDAIKSDFRKFAKKLSEQEKLIEELFIYFSGHGLYRDDETFFCCSNYTHQHPKNTSLLNSEIDELIRTISPELTVKVIDACQSGHQYIKDADNLNKDLIQKSGINKFIFMASCLQQESSFAQPNISIFTKIFFEAAVSKEISDDVYYRDIQNYIADKFKSDTKQTPLFVSQITGLEIFAATNSEIKELQINQKNFIQQQIKEKSLSERILEAIDRMESYYLPKEEVDALLQGMKPSNIKINLSDEINQKLYKIAAIDSISLKDIESAKLIAEEVAGKRWSNECFIEIEKESYRVRQPKNIIPSIIRRHSISGLGDLDDPLFETVTKYKPANININYPIPFDCLRISVKPIKLCLSPWQSYLFLIPARTYCVLVLGFVKMNRHSWDEFKVNPSEIEWLFEELPWRDWENNFPTNTLIDKLETRLKQDILQFSRIGIEEEEQEEEYKDDECDDEEITQE